MSEQQIHTEVLSNGLTVVMESMPAVQSAAFTLMIPAGSIYDAEGEYGTASVLADMITRGAGNRNSRELSIDLDNLGLQRSESAGTTHITLSGATLADNLPAVLRIYGDIVLRPLLPDDQFPAAQEGALQSLYALEDEPRQKIFSELKQRCVENPWGRPNDGTIEGVQNLTSDSIKAHWQRNFRANGAILGIAGNINFKEILDVIEEIFGSWQPQDAPPLIPEEVGPKWDHIQHDSAQTHIGIAYNSITYSDPLYYAAWASVSILSGGMSSRLFTEVREKRGLCYSIYASLTSMKQLARVLCYAGTTNERAQETLDVTLSELRRLSEGITGAELDRCKARAKSSLIMQQESSYSRSSSIARDWHHLGRVTTLDEVQAQIEALTVPRVEAFIESHPAEDFTILTIGPKMLDQRI